MDALPDLTRILKPRLGSHLKHHGLGLVPDRGTTHMAAGEKSYQSNKVGTFKSKVTNQIKLEHSNQ